MLFQRGREAGLEHGSRPAALFAQSESTLNQLRKLSAWLSLMCYFISALSEPGCSKRVNTSNGLTGPHSFLLAAWWGGANIAASSHWIQDIACANIYMTVFVCHNVFYHCKLCLAMISTSFRLSSSLISIVAATLMNYYSGSDCFNCLSAGKFTVQKAAKTQCNIDSKKSNDNK